MINKFKKEAVEEVKKVKKEVPKIKPVAGFDPALPEGKQREYR